ncbi:hypothetical protein BDM02DRAFT_3096934 [Thelephora ganbajun]|uniref:Uncharacterized protein n=1 Tax=Thelephora ganbajun TaxID=370292 RepID=A0ACB6ZFR1_THEGA|nr:hypothetical protein BDM02DRAFT_3096934 [Thelephora ganbajun]
MPEVVKTKGKSKNEKGEKQVTEPVVSEDEVEDEPVEDSEQSLSSSGSEEEDDEYAPSVHESLARASRPSSTPSSKKSKKYAPPDETPDQRDSRTIFIGNVPSRVMTTKSLLRQFKRHILSFVPTAKIESVRFRSIAFQKPTTKLPSEADPTPSSSKPPRRPTKDQESLRQHDIDRISSWRSSKDASMDDPEKKFLTPQEKKRVAFIKQDFHGDGDAVNAYIVFAHPPPKEVVKRLENAPPLPDIMDPYKAAKVAVEKCNGTTFEGKTTRVDSVRKASAGNAGGEGLGDPKLSIFVGNLDFASKEEDLRAFFEALVTNERGERPQDSEDEKGTRSSRWVTRVRIVKDKDTQLGKGFAYIQFAERECVDEVLALEQGKVKFAKRKLRVQRCKAITSVSTLSKRKAEKGVPVSSSSLQKDKITTGGTITNPRSSRSTRVRVPTPGSIPKGDPNLGKQLEHLSKEERKKEKAANADRVARRLAKKQVKAVMTKESMKFGGDGRGKERDRVRKQGRGSTRASGGSSLGKTKAKKSRIRSEANLAKRNTKK